MTDDLDQYLKECARWGGDTPEGVLRRVLHLDHRDERAKHLFPGSAANARALFQRLDHEIAVRNPGFHYVSRFSYVGYRREVSRRESHLHGERSQVFVSVVTRRSNGPIQAVLPLDPAGYSHLAQVSDLSGIGHHGIGELRFTISDDDDIALFTEVFHDWLCLRP